MTTENKTQDELDRKAFEDFVKNDYKQEGSQKAYFIAGMKYARSQSQIREREILDDMNFLIGSIFKYVDESKFAFNKAEEIKTKWNL